MRKMKGISVAGLLIMTLSTLAVCSNVNRTDNDEELIFKEEQTPLKITHNNEVPQHLVLIYDGGSHRSIQWDSEHFVPYVSTEVNGEANWLFDGFLFLEIKDGQGRGFASGYEKQAARKVEWENLLHNYFRDDNAIHALNKQIGNIRKKNSNKEFTKRKIVLSLPEPIPGQVDWGIIDGRPLRFSNKKDRLDACKWYINYAEELFRNANLENVELVGFYWLAEEATNSRDLALDVATYIYSKKYDFYWIPYFNSDGYSEWKNLGFNVVYYQPNYFFNENTPYERLQEACNRAQKFQMNLEVEFDDRALKDSKDWGYRLRDYLDVFERNGAFDSLKVAYYQGGDAFYKLSLSKEPADVELHQRLIRLITKNKERKISTP
ncbi:DUF4855 domain-containing protein [Petrimonas sp.]|uniref:DUF4855 domain-containing protein n=1 Tax=Petrimonas sp. TaxID=2023866 RepID=UPI002FC69104|nr:DUF4855 domain-containing protein [Proteiniphilum sp.]